MPGLPKIVARRYGMGCGLIDPEDASRRIQGQGPYAPSVDVEKTLMTENPTRRDLLTAARPFLAFGLLFGIAEAWLAAPQGFAFAAGIGALSAFGSALFAL